MRRLREVHYGVGALEGLAEAEAVDCLGAVVEVDCEGCFVNLGLRFWVWDYGREGWLRGKPENGRKETFGTHL